MPEPRSAPSSGLSRAARAWRSLRSSGGRHGLSIAFALLGLVILLFITVPLLKMLLSSVGEPEILWKTLVDRQVVEAIWLTFYAALVATTVGLIFGVPLAYFMARHEFRGKRLVEGLIDVPIVVPHTAAGIALLFVFGRSFAVGRAFEGIGVTFVDSTAGIVIAMLFVSVPFLIDSAKEGFKKVDVRLEKVARTLGATPWQVFVRISLPLAWQSIVAGSIMMWARGISEFGAVVILTYHPMIAPVLVFERFEAFGLDYARPVAVLLIIVSALVFVLLRVLVNRGEQA
ncbi:MAG: ABC transporter permease [Chloroflexi bacterium]|nr:ABC transporter permease [Chloroflexota bacterium]